jgi:DNA-binding transcriptional regulator YhcF (GntR family)
MTVWMQISSGSETPIYLQLVEQISKAIAQGLLRTGDKLPAVRALAAELVINPNTVARAYPRHTSWGRLAFWLVFVALLNVAGFLVY